MTASSDDDLDLHAPLARHGPVIQANSEDIAIQREYWHMCAIAFLLDYCRFSVSHLQQLINDAWRIRGNVMVVGRNYHYYILHFDILDDLLYICGEGPWALDRALLVLERWRNNIVLDGLQINFVSLWIQLHGLPLEYHHPDLAIRMGHILGVYERIDWDENLPCNISFLQPTLKRNTQVRFGPLSRDTRYGQRQYQQGGPLPPQPHNPIEADVPHSHINISQDLDPHNVPLSPTQEDETPLEDTASDLSLINLVTQLEDARDNTISNTHPIGVHYFWDDLNDGDISSPALPPLPGNATEGFREADPNQLPQRIKVWEELERIGRLVNSKWLCIGDFNQVLSKDDKLSFKDSPLLDIGHFNLNGYGLHIQTVLQLLRPLGRNVLYGINWKSSSCGLKRQKNWDINGDRNTKFFQAVVKTRRRRNRILQIKKDDTTWITNPDDIQQCFVDHYTQLFLEPQSHSTEHIHTQIRSLPIPTLSDNQVALLDQPISDAEIFQAIT
uniref:Uncharacterized protein n=1 Tax=Fagus sylvatica TaxID=28930 RepID=A0A2N9F2D4_FAGSY